MRDNEEIKEAWERLAADLKSEDPGRYFEKARKEGGKQTYICPCGAGTGQGKKNRRTGFKLNPNSKSKHPAYKCPSCGMAGSLVDFVAADRNTNYKETLQYMAEFYGYPLPGSDRAADPDYKEKQRKRQEENKRKMAEAERKNREAAEKAAKADYNSYYKACANMLFSESTPEGLAYLKGRGISEETAKRFWLGYDPEAAPRSAPGGKGRKYKNNTFPRLIIPISKKYYTARYILPGELPENVTKYDQPAGGNIEVFNTKILHNPEIQVIFVVEGALDAIATTEAGGEAVGLNGTGNELKLIKELEEEPTTATLVLCLDNDNAGEKATTALQENLRALGVHYICANIAGSCKDPNEALQKNKEAFIKAVKEAREQARAYRKEAEEMTGEQEAQQMRNAQELQEVETAQEVKNAQEKGEAAADQREEAPKKSAEELAAEYRAKWQRGAEIRGKSFLQAVTTEKYKPIPTGIHSLDEALDGGFMRQWLVTLGAAPGAGKTSLAQWIFENMAAAGNTVIFINLEMSREQLIASSLARIIKEEYDTTIPNVQILKGYQWNDMQREKITAALKIYTETTAPFICYNPEPKRDPGKEEAETSPAEIHQIIATVQETAKQAKAAGLDAPILVIDYLQVLEAEGKEDKAEIIKEAIKLLKRYAIEYNSIVFAITAQGREANKDGTSTLESGRDTSNIEYGADLVLGLDFTLCLPKEEEIIDKKTGKTVIDQASGLPKKQLVPGKRAAELTPQEKRKKTLVIHKARFSKAPQRIELLFDGESKSFTDVYGFNPISKPLQKEIETETFKI